ncbi:hypothetical protein DFH09DRAFT_1293758 [Mycena vulgaris]|nr:hypothetical protein DFH09DRAFT_1293758 [Mycena vulgaris]
MNYTITPTDFAHYWDFAISGVYVTCAEISFYGALVVLLAAAAYLLHHRTIQRRRILIIATSVMAVLATAEVLVQVWATVLEFQIFRLAVQGEVYPDSLRASRAFKQGRILYTVKYFLLVTNNAVTDSLFIYRCFMVWNRNLRVVVLPALTLLVTTAIGYSTAYQIEYSTTGPYFDSRIVFLMGVLTNVILMAMTAGRIWWIRRDARVLLESASLRRYNTVIAIILESGAIYCLSIVLYVISYSFVDTKLAPLYNFFDGALPQIVNIVPVLIIVRVGLGHGIENNGSNSDNGRHIIPRSREPGTSAGIARPPNSSFVIDIRPGRAITTGDEIAVERLEKQT